MIRNLCFICLIAVVHSVLGESTQSYKDAVTPLANECIPQVGASDDDFQAVLNRNRLETRPAKCLLACVFEKMGAFSADGRLLNGDNIMPIIDRLYGFKEYQSVLRAQLVRNCVDQVNGKDTDQCELIAQTLHCIIEQQ
ncbi:hypothetical protein B7P43_G00987 [Cryptotermes secundus]|uniref:Odorant-binding protein n=1 Tax=Cryptotermes secundus TaxID=105785 RepID=A0A2J7PFY2_9NEOP|nr:general odorant-binding protein 19d [Cryptotermes secundus]PNF15244.1 hypothetical protein B7P43_G00987 [Cryptotermes secundus]